VVNTPNNPTGKVFSREELSTIADLCTQWDCLAITDEIYEHIVYDGCEHLSLVTLPGMRERTIVINGLSKTFSITGWRLGYAIAPPRITAAVRKVHDFLTVGAPAPLQHAGAVAVGLPDAYFAGLRQAYAERRDYIMSVLEEGAFNPIKPRGAYYIMCDISDFGFADDVQFAQFLVREVGVAVVPGSSFYSDAASGSHQVRFAFPKRMETLLRAAPRLAGLKRSLAART
jgi:aspartate/methionine/tyrosine aminotransferase